MPRPTTMLNPWISTAVVIAAIGLCQFLFCTTQAMQYYAGGNIVSWNEGGYNWSRNWLSDLGRFESWSGQANLRSAVFFNTSIICLGLSLAWFFLVFGKSAEEPDGLTFAMQTSGQVSALGLVLLGLTPVDRYYAPHLAAMALWIIPIPVMAVIFAIQSMRSRGVMGWISGSVATLLALILIVAIGLYAGSDSPSGYVVMQKFVVGIAILWFAMMSLRVGLSAVETIVLSRQEKLAHQARKYEMQLQKGHRRQSQRPQT